MTIQAENGFIRIANEIGENLAKLNLSQYEWRVLWAIFRKTYGWNKKMDFVSISQIEELTELDRRNVSRAKKSLINKRILITDGNKIGFNKDPEFWLTPIVSKDTPKVVSSVSPETIVDVSLLTTNGVSLLTDTKDTTKDKKDNSREKQKKPNPPVTDFLYFWDVEFKARFGSAYVFTEGQDPGIVAKLLKSIPLDDLKGRAKLFFKDNDDWLKNNTGHTLAIFTKRVNKYIVKKPTEIKAFVPERVTPEQERAADEAKQIAMAELKEKGLLRK